MTAPRRPPAPAGAPAGAPLALLLAASLGACSPSARFGGFDEPPRVAYAAPAPLAPAPSARVTTERLPPPGPAYGAAPPAGPSVASVPLEPGAPEPLPGAPPAGEFVPPAAPRPVVTARREPVRPVEPAAPSGPPTRSAVIGSWSAKEGSATGCRVNLSSASSLDRSKASTSGCSGLGKVTNWEQSGDEVVLYEPGGAVAARLKKTGGGFEGTAAKSGAPITLSK